MNPLPGVVNRPLYPNVDPVIQEINKVAPTGEMGTMPPIKTFDDVLRTDAHIRSLADLMREIPQQQVMMGQSPEDIKKSLVREGEPGVLGKTLDYISKPFRYETSVVTAPIIGLIEALRGRGSIGELVPKLMGEALTGERELSMYDELKNIGFSNWVSIPFGIGADILLSPSTYLGIGGVTKTGKVAKAVTAAESAGETITKGSKIAEAMSHLPPEALKFAPTASEQARLGQRGLVNFMGEPLIEGAPVFEKIAGLGELIRTTPGISKVAYKLIPGLRPVGIQPQDWQKFKDLQRLRRGKIGMRSKEFLQELKKVALENNLSPDELSEVFYALERKGVPSEKFPWQKMVTTEVPEATALSAMRAKGVRPTLTKLPEDEFIQAFLESGGKEGQSIPTHLFRSTPTGPEIVTRDLGRGWARQVGFERRIVSETEGANIFKDMPKKIQPTVAKIYGTDKFSPELGEKFAEDWARFTSGNDELLTPGFHKVVDRLNKEGSHKLISGVTEIELPGGGIRRIVGDVTFVNKGQEAVRRFAKTKFEEFLKEEISLGVLNGKVDDYVNRIYRTPTKVFRPGKEISFTPFFTKKRAFKTVAEAEAAGYEPLTNILELIGIRGQKSIEATEAKRMLDEAAELFGVHINPEKMSMQDWGRLGKAGIDPEKAKEVTAYLRKQGLIPMKLGKDEVWFQPEIHDALNQMVAPFTNDETFRSFLGMYDRALNVWKGYVTAVNPKFHARNFASNVYLLWLKDGYKGFSPITHKQALDIMAGKAGQFLTDTGKVFSYDDIRRLIAEQGLMGSGFVGGELKAAFRSHLGDITKGKWAQAGTRVNPFKSQNAAISFGRYIGTHIENEAKLVGFLNDLKSIGDPVEAARRTFEYLYDYMDLTSFEKNIMKRLIPFWTWMSKNIPNMVKTTIMDPSKIGIPAGKIPTAFRHKTQRELDAAGISYPKEIEPPFVKNMGAFPVGVDEKGRVAYYAPGMPYQDLARLSLNELLSSATPFAKPFTEWLPPGGYSIFMDRPYESYPGELADAPVGTSFLPDFIKEALGVREEKYGTYMPGRTSAIVNTLLPMLRTPTKLIKAAKTPGEGQYIYPSELIGQKFVPVDPAIERRATMYEWLQNLQGKKKVERGLERREGRKAVEQTPGDLSLEEIIRLHQLRYGIGGRR